MAENTELQLMWMNFVHGTNCNHHSGHASEWTEEWGEIYGDEGAGVAKKWTNRYAEDSTRDKKWGEK